MALNIEKRTRALDTDNWSDWAITTDAPPYTDTTLIEYRIASDYSFTPADITMEKFTSGNIIVNDDGKYVWSGTGVFDDIMEAVNANIKVEFDNGRIVGQEYASTYLGGLQASLNTASQLLLSMDRAEADADASRINSNSKQYNFNQMLPIARDKAQEEYDLMENVHDSKVLLAANQAALTGQQRDSLYRQTIDNRVIKGFNAMSDTYGMLSAGRIVLSEEMWTTYFNILSKLVSGLNDYQGEWDASTNSPDISAIASPAQGDFYRVSVAGSTNLDGTSTWALNDIAVFTADASGVGFWRKSDVVLPSTITTTPAA